MHCTDESARCGAPAAVAPTPGAGPPAARYTFDEDDLASGEIADSSGNGSTAPIVSRLVV
ncbi:hypothetical protein [Streptomyces sp. MUSC 14]|uniref:hypothetical protein n=1 Tax=Streptomyces sp. MUSC 14 TaxID=1354889 RepID=UPI000ACE4F06|nr:hypothetical protein [Streptomyces sp. MUSC 14]